MEVTLFLKQIKIATFCHFRRHLMSVVVADVQRDVLSRIIRDVLVSRFFLF